MKTKLLALMLFGASLATLIAQAPAPSHKAPPGNFWLILRVSITTDSGIVGIPVGTKVKLVGFEGINAKVSDGTHEFTTPYASLTNDLDVAKMFSKADSDSQAVLQQSAHAVAEAAATPVSPIRNPSLPPVDAGQVLPTPQSHVPLAPSALDAPASRIHPDVDANGNKVRHTTKVY